MKSTNTATDENILISSSQLSEWLKEGKDVFILDVRPEEERREWSIPESRHADVYQKIKSGVSDPLEGVGLPDDRPVVTVCTAGNSSLTAAEKLRNRGIESYSLDGGMKSWNFAWDANEISFNESLTIVQIRRTAKGCLSYLIGAGDEAVVIDASLNPEVYLQLAEEHEWTIKYVMDTHLHADYVSRTRELAEAASADYLLYREAGAEFSFTPVDDRQELSFGNTSLTVLHTPGHTPESVSYLIKDQAIFTGDTLFTGGVGRPDLKADKQQAVRKAEHLYRSLQKLLSLNADTMVFPAHTAGSVRFNEPVISTTVHKVAEQTELLSLPEKEFINKVVSHIPLTPPNYLKISEINKKGSRDGYRLEELEAGANRCAVR